MRQERRAAVAVVRVDFQVPGARSLKDKRSVVKSFLQRARDRFGMAACESGYRDDPTRASVTLAAAAAQGEAARESLRRAVAFLEETYGVEVFLAEEELF